MSDALATWLSIQEQVAHLIVERRRADNAGYRRINAELNTLHIQARPLHQELLKQMTINELDAAFDARCRAILGHETTRPTDE